MKCLSGLSCLASVRCVTVMLGRDILVFNTLDSTRLGEEKECFLFSARKMRRFHSLNVFGWIERKIYLVFYSKLNGVSAIPCAPCAVHGLPQFSRQRFIRFSGQSLRFLHLKCTFGMSLHSLGLAQHLPIWGWVLSNEMVNEIINAE